MGDFVAWPGVCGFLCDGSGKVAIQAHSHYAIQLATAAPDGLRVRAGRSDGWRGAAAVLVPSRAQHTIDVSGCNWSAVLFVEPETALGRALAARLEGGIERLPVCAVAPLWEALDRAWRREQSRDAIREVITGFLQGLAPPRAPHTSDPRVLAAVEFIHQRLGGPLALGDVARAVHLSPERFRHLFVAQTGMPLRTYVLWRRLLHVWGLLIAGDSITSAAHAAGFADAAHLSRTCRAMFGMPPSVLKMNGPLSTRTRELARQSY